MKNILIILAALALVSCSDGKKNKVNSQSGGNGSSPFSYDNPVFGGGTGSMIIGQVQGLKQSTPCVNGGYRLSNDVSFYLQGGSASLTTITGSYQPGFLNNGTVTNLFVGVSAFGDLMFVTKVSNGAQVIGYNITLSFCELKSGYMGYPSIISNQRSLSNFVAPYGITITTSASCGYGVASAIGYGSYAGTYITSLKNMSDPYSPPDVQVPTSFAPPRCNY